LCVDSLLKLGVPETKSEPLPSPPPALQLTLDNLQVLHDLKQPIQGKCKGQSLQIHILALSFFAVH